MEEVVLVFSASSIIKEGGGEILPTEVPHFSRKEIADGWRLGCQVKVKDDMVIEVPEEVFGIKKYEGESFKKLECCLIYKGICD